MEINAPIEEVGSGPKLFAPVESELSNFDNSQSFGFQWKPFDRDVPLYGWEAEWEELSNRIKQAYAEAENEFKQPSVMDDFGTIARRLAYGLAGTAGAREGFFPTRGITKALIDMSPLSPVARYALPSERDKLEMMDEDERATALIQNSLAPFMMGSFKALGGMWKETAELSRQARITGKVKMVPVEDAIARVQDAGGVWKGFDYEDKLHRLVKGRHFSKDEFDAVKLAIKEGNPLYLKALQYEKGLINQPMSKGWEKYIHQSSKPYGGPEIGDELKALVDPEVLAAKHYEQLYLKNVRDAKLSIVEPNKLVKTQARHFFGEDVAEAIDIRSLDQATAANLTANLLGGGGATYLAKAQSWGSGWVIPWIRPMRALAGAAEERWGYASQVFNKITGAYSNVNRYTLNRVQTFGQMLEQRGWGKVVVDEFDRFKFVPNEKFINPKTTKAANEFMTAVDDIYAQAKGKGQKAQVLAGREVTKMMAELRSQSPVVGGLVDTAYTYLDQRYLEMLTIYPAKVLNKYPLTPFGKAVVDDLLKRHGQTLTEKFASGVRFTYTDKVEAIKKFFGEMDSTLKKNAKLIYEPVGKGVVKAGRTTTRGALKSEEIVAGVLDRLSYNNNFPAYLQGYWPRISKMGLRDEMRWNQALIGKAPFMHQRRLEIANERTGDFFSLIEMRTRSQGKQLYAMDEIGEAVEYASRLPEKWKQHTEFLISRFMGRPSTWDDNLAHVLTAAGRKGAPWGEWDAFRVMTAARNLNSLAYGGLIGVRPFAAIRNLFQPMITTMGEMGGPIEASDLLIKGMANAMNPKTRRYFKDIGIITEYLPEENLGPILPRMPETKLGVLAEKYRGAKDATLVAFRYSDRWNRYVSAGMALERWEQTALQHGVQDVGKFLQELGGEKLWRWQKEEIKALLHLGKPDEAKALYIKNVVADTQYLYHSLEAPTMLGVGGLQRSVTQFNSWWMNYGTLIGKSLETGLVTDKAERVTTGILASWAAGHVMDEMFGEGTGTKATGFGPFIGVLGTAAGGAQGSPTMYPPILQPMATMLGGISKIANEGVPKAYKSPTHYFLALMAQGAKDTAVLAVPGGLAIKQTIEGYEKGREVGAVKGFFNIKD